MKTDSTNATLLVRGLAAKTNYLFKVQAVCNSGVSPASEVSDAIKTKHLPPPGQPGKPTKTKVTYDTIELTWSKPKTGAKRVKYYTVCYYEVNDFAEQWVSQKTEGPHERVSICGLTPRAVYVFKVHAESDAGPSEESHCSDPYLTQLPPVPSQPGKPTASKNEVTDDSIKINWTAPKQNSHAVKGYIVLYCKKDSLPDGWCKIGPSESPQQFLEISGLSSKTKYYFKVQAVGVYGENSQESEVGGPIETKRKERLAEVMLPKSTRIEDGPPPVYKLSIQLVSSDPKNMIYKYCIGKASNIQGIEEKVIMVLGATGAGKSTLINGMVNYILGVEWKDQFRFKLIADEGQGSQAESQTKSITAYTFVPHLRHT